MAKPKSNSTSKVDTKRKIVCNVCGKSKTLNNSNYYQSTREEYKSYGCCPTCKDCLRKSTIDVNLGMVTKESIRPALKKLDKPLIDSVFQMVKDREEPVTNDKFLGEYITQLNIIPQYKNCTYADTVDIEIAQEKIGNAVIEEIKEKIVTDEMKRFWGRGLENQDYIDLQEMFENFTKCEEDMDFKKESDYKDLCIYQLQKSKMQFDFDSIPKVEKLQKMIDTLSDNLGIQAIQKQQEFDNNKFVLGLVVRYYEDIKKDYIRRWVEDLGHIDPLMDIVQTDYIGGLGAAMGINNPLVVEAKKRMEKYSVKLEEYFDEYEEEESEGED